METSLCPEFSEVFINFSMFVCVCINKKNVLQVLLAIDKYIQVNNNILENGSC